MLHVIAEQRSASDPPAPQGQQARPNCDSFGSYEPEYSTATAVLCHGGEHNGSIYRRCPVQAECRKATIEARVAGRRHLPIEGQPPIVNNPLRPPLTRPVTQQQTQQQQQPATRPYQSFAQRYAPTTIPGRSPYAQEAVHFPHPVIPPQEYPEAMRTPYASPTPVYGGGTSPTFLPQSGENVFERLSKNMVQGAIASMGWQVFDYLRAVDLFRR